VYLYALEAIQEPTDSSPNFSKNDRVPTAHPTFQKLLDNSSTYIHQTIGKRAQKSMKEVIQ